ncbi:MAG: threonine ammonia-lyase [Actinobacteria bacterium]|uniref:threonine ammonia-lyase n=1 Tax=freshwater metagenome TaxID=449393 RepID=A0A6J6NRZ4_9ZZZZ|nr:threonine ammonia-lyase [Actinomycetota bacterium]
MPNTTPVVTPTLEDFEVAEANVSVIIKETPLLHSSYLSELTGGQVYLKAENLQRTGAYKVRGAYNRMSKLSAQERKRGVVAASAGNHAQGVALAASKLGIKATIFMPIGASLPKVQATKGYGADVVLTGATFAECLKAAQEFSAKKNAVFIPPFDHIDVVIGQGTVGLEIMKEMPDVDNIVVAIGGGGLAAGVAVAAKLSAKANGRKVKVYGVQSEHAAPYVVSLKKGKLTEVAITPTIADGIAVSKPGRVPFELIKKHMDKVVTVSENEIAKAILVLLERAKQVVEPAGAVGVAALISEKLKLKGKTVVILSGGNMDPLLLQRVVRHGLAAAERYTTISVMLPDRPGQLALTAAVIAKANANVVEVLHTRHGLGLKISEVELNLSVETSGHEHTLEVLKALTDAGLKPRIIEARED